MSKKTIAAWLAAALLCVAGITLFLLLRGMNITDPAAEIYVDGSLYRRVDLAQDATFTVESEHGTNTIRVSEGRISVISADCPDQVCVASGAISGGAVPIICLPHRLEIRIVSAADNDTDTQIR